MSDNNITTTTDTQSVPVSITETEIEQHLERINKITAALNGEAVDDSIIARIDEVIHSESAPRTFSEYNRVLSNRMKLLEQHIDTEEDETCKIQLAMSGPKRILQHSLNEMKQLSANWTLLKTIRDVRNSIKQEKRKGKRQHLQRVLSELESSINLEILYSAAPEYDREITDKETDREFQKFINKLRCAPNLYLMDPTPIYDILRNKLKRDGLSPNVFIYSLCRFINPKSPRSLKKHSVFLKALINNILSLDKKHSSFIKTERDRRYRRKVLKHIKEFIYAKQYKRSVVNTDGTKKEEDTRTETG